jgi:hypothetical protein
MTFPIYRKIKAMLQTTDPCSVDIPAVGYQTTAMFIVIFMDVLSIFPENCVFRTNQSRFQTPI